MIQLSPDEILAQLKAGNERFALGASIHPHSDMDRVKLAGWADPANHVLATILSCSDSRVPVELIFDVGIMDVFVVRVGGNVCNASEAEYLEFGLTLVNSPLLVVLGHTQCSAAMTVYRAMRQSAHTHACEVPSVLRSIQPAVQRAIERHPDAHEDAVMAVLVEENVYQSIHNLFMASPAVRGSVKSGKLKVVGAIYDVGAGTVKWLETKKADDILAEVEKNPARAVEAKYQ